jgi:hypothetical protein
VLGDAFIAYLVALTTGVWHQTKTHFQDVILDGEVRSSAEQKKT